MSIKVMSHVWQHSTQHAGALLVHLALADFCDDEGYCFPSVATLAGKARLKARQTQYCLRELERAGELEVIPGQGRNGSNLYRLILTEKVQRVAGRNICTPAKNAPEGVHSDAPEPLRSNAPKPSKEPSIEPSVTTAREAEGKKPLSDAHAVHLRCLEIMGIDESWPGMMVHREAAIWLQHGADPEIDIYPTVTDIWTRRQKGGGDPPRSMAYFTTAIREATQRRKALVSGGADFGAAPAEVVIKPEWARIHVTPSHPDPEVRRMALMPEVVPDPECGMEGAPDARLAHWQTAVERNNLRGGRDRLNPADFGLMWNPERLAFREALIAAGRLDYANMPA